MYLATKNAVHRCSRCLNKLGIKKCFGLPNSYDDEIWQFRLGKCSLILGRLYALGLLAVMTILALVYVYMRPSYFQPISPYHVPENSQFISSTWEDYLQDCGGPVIIENFIHARIEWKGYFVENKQVSSWALFGSDIVSSLLLKMYPSESILHPDIVLSLTYSLREQQQSVLNSLKTGDEIVFRAKLIQLGTEFKMHYLQALEIRATGVSKELNELYIKEDSLPF